MATSKEDLSAALQRLLDQYNATPQYVKKTDDQLRAQAEGEYQSYYDQLRLAAKQKHETNDLTLQQRQQDLQRVYDKQREDSRRDYEDRYSRADRQMLSRGMQRSSYTAQILANLSQQGAEAQQAIWDQQAQAEGQIGDQRTQLARQLAEQLAQYDAGKAADVLNRIRQLEDQDYQRGMDNNKYKTTLSAQIYQFMQQAEQDRAKQEQWQQQFDYQKQRDAVADQQWQATFNLKAQGGNAGSQNGTRSRSPSTTPPTTQTTPSANANYGGFLNAMNTIGKVPAGNSLLTPKPTSPTVKTVYGPVNMDYINKLNSQSGTTGIIYKSNLYENRNKPPKKSSRSTSTKRDTRRMAMIK